MKSSPPFPSTPLLKQKELKERDRFLAMLFEHLDLAMLETSYLYLFLKFIHLF